MVQAFYVLVFKTDIVIEAIRKVREVDDFVALFVVAVSGCAWVRGRGRVCGVGGEREKERKEGRGRKGRIRSGEDEAR